MARIMSKNLFSSNITSEGFSKTMILTIDFFSNVCYNVLIGQFLLPIGWFCMQKYKYLQKLAESAIRTLAN